jgi:hypothetical protein
VANVQRAAVRVSSRCALRSCAEAAAVHGVAPVQHKRMDACLLCSQLTFNAVASSDGCGARDLFACNGL